MADIVLKNASAATLMTLGDAALQAGDAAMAKGFYRHAVKADPGALRAHARLGLVMRATSRAPQMLEALRAVEKVTPQAFVGEGIATWLKQPAFASDPRFMGLAAAHHDLAPAGVTNWHWNLQTVLWGAQQARGVAGDFVELGVFRGHTTMFLAEYLEFGGWDRQWWLYDTFEGIPDDQVDPGWEKVNKGAYGGGAFSFEEVRDRFAPFGNIVVTKGRVPEIFDTVVPEAIAFMHIDLNNSTAEVGALDALYDRITPGGVIVFDDFQWQSAHAQFKAELAWFQSRGLAIFPLPTGQGLFVKPPAA